MNITSPLPRQFTLSLGEQSWQYKTCRNLWNIAYFCPQCGEIWARSVATGLSWTVNHSRCRHCGGTESLRNHIHWPDYDSFYRNIPLPMLYREFLLFAENPELYFTPGY